MAIIKRTDCANLKSILGTFSMDQEMSSLDKIFENCLAPNVGLVEFCTKLNIFWLF